MQLYQHYHQERHRIEAFLNFSQMASAHKIVLCYLTDNEQEQTTFFTLGSLLLTLTCPNQTTEIPAERWHQEVQQAMSLSQTLRTDIKTLRNALHYPIKEE
ncbi:TPA: hypothetical protein ACX6QF_003974 [Photobacterium damselae]